METDVKVKKYCHICGKAHKAKYTYCKRCGVNLDSAEIAEIYESNIGSVYSFICMMIFVFILFASIGVYIWIESGVLWGGFFLVPLIGIVPLGILAFINYLNRWRKFIVTDEKIEFCSPNKSRTINWSEFDVINLKARGYRSRGGQYARLKFDFYRYNENYPVRKIHFQFNSHTRARQIRNLTLD